MLRVVNLQVMAQDDMLLGAVVVECIAPQLLLLGQQIAVAGHHITGIGLAILTSVAIEVIAIDTPDVGALEEVGTIALHVVDHRVTSQFILLIAHLDPLDTNQILRIGIVVTAVGLDEVIPIGQHTAVLEKTDVLLRVKLEMAGIERSLAIDHLDDGRIDNHLIQLTVVIGPIAIDVGRVFIDKHIAEALDMGIGVAHGRIGGDDRSVVLGSEVPHHKNDRIALPHRPREV